MKKTPIRYYTTADLARILAVRPKTVRTWIEEGELKAIKVGRQWRIAPSELDRLVREWSRASR